jgi:hypothetical protein
VNTNAHGTQLVEAGPNSQPQPQAYAAYAAFLVTYAPPSA